ncbi:uncharacterized protein EI90DRAFT_3050869, partial [Cantharellus anzutake]|uniref:uncharacterized protein n=1 Tax=Cantharellus anzutake TaxID=1750568 RepID=UPI001906107D
MEHIVMCCFTWLVLAHLWNLANTISILSKLFFDPSNLTRIRHPVATQLTCYSKALVGHLDAPLFASVSTKSPASTSTPLTYRQLVDR